MNNTYLSSLNWRYATKEFDSDYQLPLDKLNSILEAARLAPSSYGIEPWRIIRVTNPEVRKKIREAGFDQSKITDASELLVIVARKDGHNQVDKLIERITEIRNVSAEDLAGYTNLMHGTVDTRKNNNNEASWLKSQTYILLGFLLFAAALEGVDAGPMEGFEPDKVGDILEIDSGSEQVATMVALGKRSSDDEYADYKKVRRTMEDLVEVKK